MVPQRQQDTGSRENLSTEPNPCIQRRSPLSVCVCVLSIVSHVRFSDFVAKMKDFVAKTKDFWWRWRIFYFFFVLAKKPSSLPHCLQCLPCMLMKEAPSLSMCRHTNEGIPSTVHVQMLHWACVDTIMRLNPVTDMTDNTEEANTNWQCLHTYAFILQLFINFPKFAKFTEFLIHLGKTLSAE